MKRIIPIVCAILALSNCASHSVKTDPYDGSKIVEHEISGQDVGDGSVLHFLSTTYKKKLYADGRSNLKASIHLIGNTNRTMKVDPAATFKIDSTEFEIPLKDDSSTIDQSLKVDKNSEVVDKGLAFLNIYAELDLQSIKDKLNQAKSVKIRFKRGGESAVFVYTEKQIAELKALINHNGLD